MDPAAEITQWVHPVAIPESPSADARRLQCSPTLAGPVSKVLDDDNLLIEIILRLGFPTTLVRAALVCKHWLCHASDPAFLRRFRKLHPPHLLGFYLDVRSWSLRFNPTRPCFVPVLPQPPELTAVARRVANYSFDAYDSIWIEDLQNGRILIRESASRFGPGADILVLDLRTSSFTKIQLPEGVDVEYNRTNTMFSRTDDDSRVYLFHVKEFQLSIWLHNGDNKLRRKMLHGGM